YADRYAYGECYCCGSFLFCFHGPAAAEFYTLSLHDALPILSIVFPFRVGRFEPYAFGGPVIALETRCRSIIEENGLKTNFGCDEDRKSTRLNSSHVKTSYAVFCLKKKNKEEDCRQ